MDYDCEFEINSQDNRQITGEQQANNKQITGEQQANNTHPIYSEDKKIRRSEDQKINMPEKADKPEIEKAFEEFWQAYPPKKQQCKRYANAMQTYALIRIRIPRRIRIPIRIPKIK